MDCRIGDRVSFRLIYHGKASKRFKRAVVDGENCWRLTALDRPLSGTAVVTGISRRIMSGFWRGSGDELGVMAGGDRELVLLVRTKPGRRSGSCGWPTPR